MRDDLVVAFNRSLSMTQDGQRAGLTGMGKVLSFLMVAALIGLGVWLVMRKDAPAEPGQGTQQTSTDPQPAQNAQTNAQATESRTGGGQAAAYEGIVDAKTAVPQLAPPQPYRVPESKVIDVELSEYAGYSGLIVANGGLKPNDNSFFAKNYGFKVNITLSEEESWDKLNTGKLAASATTADVLAVFGRQFNVVVPAQIAFSRGADGIVVRNDISRINQLKGKTLTASQFTEAEFFIRYLAQEAGIGINVLPDLGTAPAEDKINLLFCEDAFVAGDVFAKALENNDNRIAGCVTWAPKTTEVADGSGGKAKILTTNRNLLIIADILIVNRGFAEQNPEMVRGLVHGLLEGNRMVRAGPDQHLDTIVAAFNTLYEADDPDRWTRESARDELSRVHLSNLPENQAFFKGEIDAAGSFDGIYSSAILSYGDLIRNPVDSRHFYSPAALDAIAQAGVYKTEQIAIAPVRTGGGSQPLEADPLLSKDIRFYFLPNSSQLDLAKQENLDNLADIKQLLQVSPGSKVLLRGHVDSARMEEFRRQGGEAMVRKMALEAMRLSKERATEVQRILLERNKLDPQRVEIIGRGWEEPAEPILGTDPSDERSRKSERNRRVEVYWYTLE
jgi:NitT/TauT family transport system substrate-binding protein